MFRIFVFAFIYALLSMGGCTTFQQPETKTKVVDRPDVPPMALPAIGWVTTVTVHEEYSSSPDVDNTFEHDVYLRQHASGAVADYSGFLIYVTGEAFSFQVKKYWAYSWYYGWIELTIEGAGDAGGATTFVRGDYDGGWYTLDFELTHVAELAEPVNPEGFVPAGPFMREAPLPLPLTPDDVHDLVAAQTYH